MPSTWNDMKHYYASFIHMGDKMNSYTHIESYDDAQLANKRAKQTHTENKSFYEIM